MIIKDLGSSNGTYVNDEKVDSHVLKMSDRIRIGELPEDGESWRNLCLFRSCK